METDNNTFKQMLDELLNVAKKNLPKVDESLITKAFNYSLEAHKNDIRASGEPYIVHPHQVAMIVAEEFTVDDITVASALLHDVVEDTDCNIDTIKKNFGEEIAEIVDGVTKISGIFRGQEISKAENYHKFLLSIVKDLRVILVKFADRLHNMYTLEFVNPNKQRKIALETLEIYAPLAHRFGLGKIKWELEDLAFKYLNREAYEDIAKKLNSKRSDRENYINLFSAPIIEKLKEYNIKFELSGRPKHLYSIYNKMIKRNKPFEEIYDLFAIRIIIDSKDPSTCYTVYGLINSIYHPVPDRFKDYIAFPKMNKYQSIHSTYVGPQGRLVEVQIRTKEMHEIAEKGFAAHWKYKENKHKTDKDIETWINWIREIFETANRDDQRKELFENFKLNLYQNEIYVFTPKGDLIRLPFGSTPVDFAYQIHTSVGNRCIGAKVNGKIVPLVTQLKSGDQIEILLSNNQKPNRDWLKFVKTTKAKNEIKKWLNKEEQEIIQKGKEIWDKKLKKLKLNFSDKDLMKIVHSHKYDNSKQFFKAIAQGLLNIDDIIKAKKQKEEKENQSEIDFNKFINSARGVAEGITVDGKKSTLLYSFAKCCNPIPGDPIIGYITVGEGIKIHRKNCINIIKLSASDPSKLVNANWSGTENSLFIAGIIIRGKDRPGIVNDISNSILTYQNTNIESFKINKVESSFEGSVFLFVQNLEHLKKIIERIKKIENVSFVERFESFQ